MPAEPPPILEARDLRKTFPDGKGEKVVLDGMNLAISKGEFVCVVGPSGAGKTTLLRCLAGLYAPTSGSVSFESEPIDGPPRGMAVVFQDYSRSLLPWKRVLANVELPLKSAGWDAATRRQRAETMLTAVGLEGSGHLYPRQMSGGMQQRVAIARALAPEPDLLLMDEPFAALDAQTRQDLEDLILKVRDDFGVTVVFVTHDIDEAVYVSDRVAVLSKVPSTITEVVDIPLPTPRDPFSTKAHPLFAELRTHVLELVRGRAAHTPPEVVQ